MCFDTQLLKYCDRNSTKEAEPCWNIEKLVWKGYYGAVSQIQAKIPPPECSEEKPEWQKGTMITQNMEMHQIKIDSSRKRKDINITVVQSKALYIMSHYTFSTSFFIAMHFFFIIFTQAI